MFAELLKAFNSNPAPCQAGIPQRVCTLQTRNSCSHKDCDGANVDSPRYIQSSHLISLKSLIFLSAPVTPDCTEMSVVVIQVCESISNRFDDAHTMVVLRSTGAF